jgi:hypothetical protein
MNKQANNFKKYLLQNMHRGLSIAQAESKPSQAQKQQINKKD